MEQSSAAAAAADAALPTKALRDIGLSATTSTRGVEHRPHLLRRFLPPAGDEAPGDRHQLVPAVLKSPLDRRFSFSAIALRIMRSPRTGGNVTVMPDEPSTPEICDRPVKSAPAKVAGAA